MEKLSDDQLDQVVGGAMKQFEVEFEPDYLEETDKAFFYRLDGISYEIPKNKLNYKVKNGVKYICFSADTK